MSLALIISVLPVKNTKAAAYEFWGTPAKIDCNVLVDFGSEVSGSLSVTAGRIPLTINARMKPRKIYVPGTENTCNGFKDDNCAGTDCFVEKALKYE